MAVRALWVSSISPKVPSSEAAAVSMPRGTFGWGNARAINYGDFLIGMTKPASGKSEPLKNTTITMKITTMFTVVTRTPQHGSVYLCNRYREYLAKFRASVAEQVVEAVRSARAAARAGRAAAGASGGAPQSVRTGGPPSVRPPRGVHQSRMLEPTPPGGFRCVCVC